MTIEEMVKKFIDEGGSGRLDIQVGKSGVVFLDEGEFISFDDLGYNEQLGFFKKSLFPKQKNEADSIGRNTKARSQEILSIAHLILDEQNVDVTEAVEIRPLAKILKERAGCHYNTARLAIAKAVRRKRGKLMAQWGGARPGAGRPKSNDTEA